MKTVLIVSIVFQIVAVICTVRLMYFTKKYLPWILLLSGIILMVVRRAIPLFELFSLSENIVPSNTEIISMITSILFSLGCVFILPVIKKIRRNEDYLKITLNSVGDAIITTDINGKVSKMNPIAEKLSGWNEINAKGKLLSEVFNIVNAENDNIGESPVDIVFENGTIVGLANYTKLISKNGIKYHISNSVATIRNKFGYAVGVVLVFKDLTSEYEMCQNISESEKKLKTIFNAAKNVSFITTDVDLNSPKILEFSPGAEHIFGYKSSEVIGKPVAILHQKENVERFSEVIESLRKNKKGFDGEDFLVRKSGELFPALFSTFPVFDSDGELISTIGVSIDISERKCAEENLKRSEAKFHASFEQGLVGMSITSEKMEWLEVNEFLCQMLGYSRYELLKKTWVELTYFEDIEADISNYNKLLSGEINGYSLEKRFCHKNGSLVWAVISVSVIRSKENNSIEHILGVFNNISEQKKQLKICG
jgi:PAS domain S-box-containing protein